MWAAKFFWFNQRTATASRRYPQKHKCFGNQTSETVVGNFRRDIFYSFYHNNIKSLPTCSIKKGKATILCGFLFHVFLIYTLSFRTNESVLGGLYPRRKAEATTSIHFWSYECLWQREDNKFSIISVMSVDNPSSSKTSMRLLINLAGVFCARLECLVPNCICCVSRSFIIVIFSARTKTFRSSVTVLMPAAFPLCSFMCVNFVSYSETNISSLATILDVAEQSLLEVCQCLPLTSLWKLSKQPKCEYSILPTCLRLSMKWLRACHSEVAIFDVW